ncbi:MAG: HlyC/CorC family transporter [Deltaproteobacteria bacterium]|nr:HlyC/CorC family transporter [Deltaproteobacteria bacterium]
MEGDSGTSPLRFIRSLLRRTYHVQKGEDLTEEIHDLMNEGQAKGFITGEESDMVYGVLDLKDTQVRSIMIPRTSVVSASSDATLGEMLNLVKDCGHTRIPIFKGSIDEITGILHAKDILRLWGKDPQTKIPSDILRKPYFIPLRKRVSELLKELRERKSHLAIVTDEYGGTAGIITIEDILEEIVGEIQDEHDREPPFLTVLDENSILVDARLEIEKMEEHFRIKLPEGDYESVGGFIISILGRIPKAGEKVHHDNLEMTVQSADMRKVDEIVITRLAPSTPEESSRDDS